MKWRCPKCGKPHERNDPPCDNCGHHKLERAVVPQASADEDREEFVWACSECGRHHQRNNPPCSRCGNANFEKKPLDYDEFEPGDTAGYLELAGKQELAAVGVIALLAVIGALGFYGVIDIPGLTDQGPPTVENVPGDADVMGNITFDEIEAGVVKRLDRVRSEPLERNDGLDGAATFVNRIWVKDVYTDANPTYTREDVRRFDTPCSGSFPEFNSVRLDAVNPDATVGSLADQIAVRIQMDEQPPTDSDVAAFGIDIHAPPDGGLYVTTAYC